MDWTDEQRAIIGARDGNKRVRARAGTGKTSTLRGYTKGRPTRRFVYLVFNKANQREAEATFPRNVKALTSHALAFRQVGVRYRHKLADGNIRAVDLSRVLGCDYKVAADALKLLNTWFGTSSARISDVASRSRDHQRALPYAEAAWNEMVREDSRSILMPHDGYLKLFDLEDHMIAGYDGIVFDEAQDANPITLNILRRQKQEIVAVGDEYQSIYGFRGAVNALDIFDGADFSLTNCFRFGGQVAAVANSVLLQFGEKLLLKGLGGNGRIFESMPANAQRYTFLSRTNAGVIEHAIAARGRELHFVGGIDGYRVDRILDAFHLYSREPGLVQDREFKQFRDYGQLLAYAQEIDDIEIKAIAMLVDQYGAAIPDLLQDLRRRSAVPQEKAAIVLTTAHRSKGLEWDSVILGEFFDWGDYLEARQAGRFHEYREELNLLYVAATRARRNLVINSALVQAIREAYGSPRANGSLR